MMRAAAARLRQRRQVLRLRLSLLHQLELIRRRAGGAVNPTETMEILMRFLISFCIGIAVTVAWQSYGDAAREMIANSSPQLGWLAPQDAVAQTASAAMAPTESSLDPQQLKAMSADLAVVRQRVDQLAAQVAAGQEQIGRDFAAKLQTVEQEILDKVSAPPRQQAAAPIHKPTPPLQVAPIR